MLTNVFHSLKEKIVNSWRNLRETKSTLNIILDALVLIIFGLTMFSIPTFSFTVGKTMITWVLTGILMVLLLVSCFLYYGFAFNYITLTLILFIVCATISSALNKFINFQYTVLLLPLVTIAIYTYSLKNPESKKWLIISTMIGIFVFAIVFICKYFRELITFDYFRLGGIFGDENDIATFFGLGFLISFFYIFESKKWSIRGICIFLSLLFTLLGFSTGSRIFMIAFFIIAFAIVIRLVPKKRKWIVVVGAIGVLGLFLLSLNLSFMAPVTKRVNSLIAALLGKTYKGEYPDNSAYCRINMFLDGFNMFFKKPLFGFGVNGFANFGNMNNAWSHNQFSETLCNYGVFGTFFFHFGFVYALVDFNKRIHEKEIGLPLIVLIYFIISMFGMCLDGEKIYVYFIGIILAYSKEPGSLVQLKGITALKKKELANETC